MKLRNAFIAFGLLIAVAVAVPLPAFSQDAENRPIAIVVHPDTDISNLTLDELRDIFLAERLYWPDNSRIVLLVRAPAAYERTFVLDRIYRMSEADFRSYWIKKMFRAEISSGPRVVFSNNMAIGLVTAIPGSIAFMLASDVTPDVKVVRIDGKLPSEEGYPLR
jgi:ABC-type phosphate transport system substrate-binding protein